MMLLDVLLLMVLLAVVLLLGLLLQLEVVVFVFGGTCGFVLFILVVWAFFRQEVVA